MVDNVSTISEGSKVIIRRGTFMRSEVVCMKKKVSIQKLHFYLDNAIGCKFGTTFTVKDKHLHITEHNVIAEEPKSILPSGENNQFINDDGSSQKMSTDDIMALKAEGVTGEKIIDRLIENSDTFDKKTEFSQAKYVKKKKQKHVAEVTLLKPTLPLICDMLYANGSGKILELRKDTVSQILTRANIQSNMNVMVLENTQSFLVGTVLRRMGGLGNLIQFYNGDFPCRLCLSHFDFAQKELEILHGFRIQKIDTIKDTNTENMDTSMLVQPDNTAVCSNIPVSEAKIEKTTDRVMFAEPDDENDSDNEKNDRYRPMKSLTEQEKIARKQNRDLEEEKALRVLRKDSLDSLIIATKFHATTVLLKLLEFLAPSRQFVVYSPYKEVLVDCYLAVKKRGNAILLNITETWWRNYQVLSQRTHPHIMMDGAGGYILTGVKIESANTTENSAIAAQSSKVSSIESPAKKLKTL